MLQQRRPDPLKEEGLLRRVFSAEQVNRVVFYEQAVLSDPAVKEKVAYELFVVTLDSLYHIDPSNSTASEIKGIPLDEIDFIEQLPDIASFFEADIARHTRHYRIHISNQVLGTSALLDFYTYFEDSSLGYFLTQSWLHAKTRSSLSGLYMPMPRADSPLSLLPSNNAAALLFSTLKQQYLGHSAGFEPQLSKLPSNISSNYIPGFLSMASEAIEARSQHLVAKIRSLEELVVCLTSPRSLMFQRLIMSHTDVCGRLIMDLSLAAPNQSLYVRAYANHLRSGAPESDVKEALKALGENSEQQNVSTKSHSNVSNLDANVAPIGQNELTTHTSADETVSTSDQAGFQSEKEVFDAREGHFAEELMRVELALTTLTVVNLTLQGSHAIGKQRLQFLEIANAKRFIEIINACTLTNQDYYHPSGAGRELLEVARRKKLQLARNAHEKRFRQQQLDMALIQDHNTANAVAFQNSIGISAVTSRPDLMVGEAVSAVKYRHQVDDKTIQTVFDKLKLRLFELDNQVAWFLLQMFDLCEQSKALHDVNVKLSADWLVKTLLAIPRFSTDRVPNMVRRLSAMLQQSQTPNLGFFIYVTLDVLNKLLARSMPLRYSISKICSDIFTYDLSRRELLDNLRTSSHFFNRLAARKLTMLVDYVRGASEGAE